MPDLWDPLTYDNLMAGTVAHFEEQEQRPLVDSAGIEGPGIYALYYIRRDGRVQAHRGRDATHLRWQSGSQGFEDGQRQTRR